MVKRQPARDPFAVPSASKPPRSTQPPRSFTPAIPAERHLEPTHTGGRQTERSFFCRSCQMVTRGLWVPAGWYLLERSAGGAGRHFRLGLYCSLACLIEAKEDLTVGAATHADRLGLPAEDPRARQRLLDTAQTLLHAGSTIRAAGDTLGVPTSTLRHWLRQAGIIVGPDGTLTGNSQAEPTSTPAVSTTGLPTKPAVSVINELTQLGRITAPAWETATTGPPHAPTFTVTLTTTADHGPVSVCGEGPTKSIAKTQAAQQLLAHLDKYPDS